MNKRTKVLLVILFSIALLAFSLGTYILIMQGSLQPRSFFTTCFEVIKNVQEHIHINTQVIIGAFVIATITISTFLAIFQFINFLFSYYHLNTQTNYTGSNYKSKLNKLLKKHNIQPQTISILDNNKLTAYTFGLFRPKIVISRPLLQKLTVKQLEAVILHELFHIQNRHTLWLLIIRTISSFLFFIPIFKYLYSQLKTEFEISADAYVEKVQKTNTYLRQAIVLNLVYRTDSFTYFVSSPIEKRVEYLVNKKSSFDKISIWQLSLSIVSFFLMLGIVINNPRQVLAQFAAEDSTICKSQTNCESQGCLENASVQKDTFTIFVPASFQSIHHR